MAKADFTEIINLIDEEIVTNGQGLIDAVLLRGILKGMLTAVGANLDGKVDTETGKGLSTNDLTNTLLAKINSVDGKVDKVQGKSLILDTLITKLSNMPTITGFNAETNRITIGGKEYELTPYVPIPDYYVGWTSGNAASFQAKTAQELVNGAGDNNFMVATNPTYQHACIDKIFYLLFKTDKAPTGGSLVSGGLESQISASDFLSGGIIHHDPITYDGTTYKVYTYADDDLISDSNIITVNFQ